MIASIVCVSAVNADTVTLWGIQDKMSVFRGSGGEFENYDGVTHYDYGTSTGANPHEHLLSPEIYRGDRIVDGFNPQDREMFLFVLDLDDCAPDENGTSGLASRLWLAFFDFTNPNQGVDFNKTTVLDVSEAFAINNDDVKKGAIQTLFNHAYQPMLDAWDAYQDGTGDHYTYDLYSCALQLALWEIVREKETDLYGWDVSNGTTGFLNRGGVDDDLYDELVTLVNGWLAALQNEGPWDPRFATAMDCTIMIFTGDNYKSWLAVTMVNEFTIPDPVPAPATLLVLGLGMAGVPLARRFRRS